MSENNSVETTEPGTDTEATDSTHTENSEQTSSEKTDADLLYDKPEDKGEGEDKSEDKGEDDKDGDKTGLTIDDIKLPEGVDLANEEQINEFVELVNQHNLSKEVVQDLVDYQARLAEQASERAGEAFAQMQEQWQQEAHDRFGGADKLETALARISGVLTEYGKQDDVPEGTEQKLRDAFAMTGAGNHPEVVAFMDWVSSHFEEGSLVSGQPGTSDDRTVAQVLYPSMK